MDERTQAVFDQITAKDVVELTHDDIAFLKARRKYLSRDLKAKFASVLEAELPEANVPVDPNFRSEDDLLAQAQELGLPTEGRSREELELDIATVLGPANAPEPV